MRRKSDQDDRRNDYRGVSRSDSNTLCGVFDENRGRRSFDTRRSNWSGSPFENEREYNWNHRQGWDQYYNQRSSGSRHHGGSLIGHDRGGHSGRGPKGYRRSDDSIFHDVCDTLTMSADIDASDIEVTVKDGVVYLNGTVSDREM